MNSYINANGKRSWKRTDEIDRILGSFSLLNGYTDEIDNLIVESMKEIGFSVIHPISPYHLMYEYDGVAICVSQTDFPSRRWQVAVGDVYAIDEDKVREKVLVPRALWCNIRQAWDRFKKENTHADH